LISLPIPIRFKNLVYVSAVITDESVPALYESQIPMGKNIVVADDAKGFISSIARLIEDRPHFDEISKNAIEFIHENFDNLSSAGALVEFYKKHIE